MLNAKLYVGSHAPFWHNGRSITGKSYHFMLAALPAVIMGIYQYGAPALAVISFSVSCSVLWELLINRIMRRRSTIRDGNAAVIGLLFAMLLPATTPWWAVAVGTFVAVVIGKQIFGGLGCNPFNPSLVALAMMMLSWGSLLDFDIALVNYDLDFYTAYPLKAFKHFGSSVDYFYSLPDMFLGRQIGGLGSTFGLGLVIGGLYLILRGFVRWEISISFLVGIFGTALVFHLSNPESYVNPMYHLVSGYTLIAAFFLAPEDSSSPVNFIPMLLYGAGAGVLTVLIRNIGAFADGAVFAILMLNVANPLIDKIRPKPLGKGINYA
jgi:electron transport complex protein RnfD